MHKTTIYLGENELKDLRALAAKRGGANVAELIRQAVRGFVKNAGKKDSFSFLKKHLQKKKSKSSFGNAVEFQKSLRRDWDKR